ncbi:MAG: alpha/beta hydrolase-fold protein [Actinomycetota bacterium]
MGSRPPLIAGLCALALAASAHAVIPEQAPDLPVLGAETPRGHISIAPAPAVSPSPKVVDGETSDWIGTTTRLGGTAIYSAGEYVYQDYLGDDSGADDGQDVERLAKLDPLIEAEPRLYRLDALEQAAGDELGVPRPIGASTHYGDAAYPQGLDHHADIAETRVAADADRLYLLVRTTGMTANPGTAVLVLVDTEPGGSFDTPGGITSAAEWAFIVAGDRLLQLRYKGADVAAACPLPCTKPVEVATNPDGFVNAVEIGIWRNVFSLPDVISLGVATGVVNEAKTGLADIQTGDAAADLFNVAFRFEEPVRIHMDRQQALALYAGSTDRFLAGVDLGRLVAGASETFTPGPGYYDRIYLSDSPVNREVSSGGEFQGTYQHYGLYLPKTYDPATPAPALLWLHPRSSGTTHLAGAWVPGIIRQLGERSGRVVISPSARGSSTWYVGRGHEDFRESWDDAMASFSIDPNKIVVAGHSMGGFGSYLVGLLYPDRFAAAFPISGPPTQGAWLGAGAPFAEQNGGNLNAELLFNIIENARNLPYVIYHGINDELVFTPGVVRMASRFTELGYRNRLYLFPGQDHYAPLIVDEWADAQRYLNSFTRDPNPAHVTYRVWPALEHQVETIGVPEGATLDYAFDGAYWVDGLTIRDGDPADPKTWGTFDGVTLGRSAENAIGAPEGGVAALGQTSPFLMTGWQWLSVGAGTATSNAATLTLTNIATASLDVARMGLSTANAMTLTVASDGAAVLNLAGTWSSTPVVTGATAHYAAGILAIDLTGGDQTITIAPSA